MKGSRENRLSFVDVEAIDGAGSGFAGSGRKPALSGFNTARRLPLRAKEGGRRVRTSATRVEPRISRPLQ